VPAVGAATHLWVRSHTFGALQSEIESHVDRHVPLLSQLYGLQSVGVAPGDVRTLPVQTAPVASGTHTPWVHW
jgi:hypothetical protein